MLINSNSKFETLVTIMYGLAFEPPIRAVELFSTVILDYMGKQKEDVGFHNYQDQIKDFISYDKRTWIRASQGTGLKGGRPLI